MSDQDLNTMFECCEEEQIQEITIYVIPNENKTGDDFIDDIDSV